MKSLFICLILLASAESFSQGEPWKRPLKIGSSPDGQTFLHLSTFQDSSGVPCMIRLSSGVLICAFQWFRQPVGSASWDRVAVKFSSNNGITWTQPAPIVVNNFPANFTRPFDPALALTDSGKIRIYFSSGLNMILDTSINTYSAISDDGINYTMEPGIRFSLPDRPVIDPAVIKFKNLWHLVNPVTMGGTGAYHNVSNDGLNFTRVQDIQSDPNHSWIGNYMIRDTNELRFYGSGMKIWFSSTTNGGVWSAFTSTNIAGGDPTVVKLSADNYLMVYTGQPYTVSISEQNINTNGFVLHQNYPNPFNPVSVISYSIMPAADSRLKHVSLKIYDNLGCEVAVLADEKKLPGNYSHKFDAANFPSGIYFYTLTAGDHKETKKMLLVR